MPDRAVDRESLVQRIVAAAEDWRGDEATMSALHNAPNVAMIYITERLGTSQQILIQTLAQAISSLRTTAACGPAIPADLRRCAC